MQLRVYSKGVCEPRDVTYSPCPFTRRLTTLPQAQEHVCVSVGRFNWAHVALTARVQECAVAGVRRFLAQARVLRDPVAPLGAGYSMVAVHVVNIEARGARKRLRLHRPA